MFHFEDEESSNNSVNTGLLFPSTDHALDLDDVCYPIPFVTSVPFDIHSNVPCDVSKSCVPHNTCLIL